MPCFISEIKQKKGNDFNYKQNTSKKVVIVKDFKMKAEQNPVIKFIVMKFRFVHL